jgi:hypothetical protein
MCMVEGHVPLVSRSFAIIGGLSPTGSPPMIFNGLVVKLVI